MKLSVDIKRAVDKCIECHIPFVVYCRPMVSVAEFFSNPSRLLGAHVMSDNDKGFAIALFNSCKPPYLITQECDALQTLTLSVMGNPSKVSPWSISTDRNDYLRRVNLLIKQLKNRGGKTVFSKVVAGQTDNLIWSDIIDDYFLMFQSTFRYAYYLPETGFWLGASPEILLESVHGANTISTMSLAGTRNITNIDKPWDIKNKEEHDIVTQYIVDSLHRLGIITTVSAYENVAYGTIEHLCNRITGLKTEQVDLYDIANQLSPTPALAGFPLSDAINDICRFESHPRHCYGGYIAINDITGFCAYVNLRCVHFNHTNYCIYGGGGITALSNAIDEWNETEAKISRLRNLIRQKQHP